MVACAARIDAAHEWLMEATVGGSWQSNNTHQASTVQHHRTFNALACVRDHAMHLICNWCIAACVLAACLAHLRVFAASCLSFLARCVCSRAQHGSILTNHWTFLAEVALLAHLSSCV